MQYYKNYKILLDEENLFKKILAEKEKIGYYSLSFNDLTYLKELEKFEYSEICLIGIGGSSLGVEAIYKFLKYKKNLKKLTIFDTTDPIDLESKLSVLSNNPLFLLISKSGSTIETIAIFKYISSKINLDKNNLIIISEINSPLYNYAKEKKISFFEIPKNVGGRFSVFSNVGLVPLYLVGVDVKNLLNGAKEVINSFFNKSYFYEPLIKKAYFLVQNKDKYNINVLFSYSSLLEGFNKWYVQLWGESLGKINSDSEFVGLTPIGLIGPNDQHSFLQLIMQGKRDKSITFIKVDDFKSNLKIPDIKISNLEKLDILNGISFNKLINLQADSTYEALKNQKDIPIDLIEIEIVDEYNIAKLMQSFMLLTSLVGAMLGIDTYNQPAVEFGKKILKEKLYGKR